MEATCPTAGQDPCLAAAADGIGSSGYVPHDSILLRWTAARDHKVCKGAVYRDLGIIKPGEAYVVAINGALIGSADYGLGISQLPYIVEMTMGIGPLQFHYRRDTLAFVGAHHDERHELLNHNGQSVSGASFLNRGNANVSALIGFASFYSTKPTLPLFVAHNPLAGAGLGIAPGHFGPHSREWMVDSSSGDLVAVPRRPDGRTDE